MNDISKQLNEFLEQNGLTGASIARSIGVSTGTVSLVKTGKIEQVSDDNLKKFADYMANYGQKADTTATTVATQDLKLAHFTIDEVMISRGMGTILGKAGTGKTEAVKAYTASHPEAILIETIPSISLKSLLIKILEAQGDKSPVGNTEQLLMSVVANFKKSERVLLIDEAENLTTKNLEAVRRIHDFSRVPTVLIGTYALLSNLRGRGGDLLQLYSRIGEKYKMQGLNDNDRAELFGDMGQQIKKFTQDIRRSCLIFNKAKRMSDMNNEKLSPMHIQMATQSVILD